jgi:hypothetical protein
MKKLLLVILIGITYNASAMDLFRALDKKFGFPENKDNSLLPCKANTAEQAQKITRVKVLSDRFDELQKEFTENNNYSLEEIKRFQQQKNKLKRKVRQSTFPVIDRLFLIPHIPYLRELDNKISSATEKISLDERLYMPLQLSVAKLQMEDTRKSYAKKVTLDDIKDLNDKDNDRYYEDLLLLEATKTVMEHNWRNVSWFQWLWNYRAYTNYQRSIQMLDEEIALMKDQDRIVSREKTVYNRGEEAFPHSSLANRKSVITATNGKYYFPSLYEKSQLTHREVFTRSHMPRSKFEQVKTARE